VLKTFACEIVVDAPTPVNAAEAITNAKPVAVQNAEPLWKITALEEHVEFAKSTAASAHEEVVGSLHAPALRFCQAALLSAANFALFLVALWLGAFEEEAPGRVSTLLA
jgi:hypothetical protein